MSIPPLIRPGRSWLAPGKRPGRLQLGIGLHQHPLRMHQSPHPLLVQEQPVHKPQGCPDPPIPPERVFGLQSLNPRHNELVALRDGHRGTPGPGHIARVVFSHASVSSPTSFLAEYSPARAGLRVPSAGRPQTSSERSREIDLTTGTTGPG